MPRHPVPARAKEVTPEEAEQRREEMRELNQAIKGTLADARTVVWDLAAQLERWEDEVGWSALGYDSLTAWLADPEVAMTRSRYYDLVSSYREMRRRQVEPRVMRELEPTKVAAVMPAVKAGRAYFDDAINDAATLSQRDLRDKYQGRRAVDSGRPESGQPESTVADAAEPPAFEGTATEVDTEKGAQNEPPTSGHLSGTALTATICESCGRPMPVEPSP